MKGFDWSDLEVVHSVASHGSIAAAARELDLHYSTVMRRIERFQRDHDVRLFVRSAHGLEVADSARGVLDRIDAIAGAVQSLERSLKSFGHASSGLLSLTVPRGLLATELMPVLARLQALEPTIQMSVVATDEMLEVGGPRADIAIRVLQGAPPEHLVARPLGQLFSLPYASRAYLDRHDPFRCPERAHWLTGPTHTDDFPGNWHDAPPFDRIPVRNRYDDISFLCEAARQSLGIAVLPCIVADQDPVLIRLPGQTPRRAGDLWVLTHPDIARLQSVRVCLDTLSLWVRSLGPRLQGCASEPTA